MLKVISKNAEVTGTHLQGRITTSYDKLVEVFGEPTYNDNDPRDKVQVEWALKFSDGTVATIYNWKDYDDGSRCKQALHYDWHIGGMNYDAVMNVYELAEEEVYYGA